MKVASEKLGVSVQTLYRLVRNGDLAVVKIGDRTLFCREDLEDFVALNTCRAQVHEPLVAGDE